MAAVWQKTNFTHTLIPFSQKSNIVVVGLCFSWAGSGKLIRVDEEMVGAECTDLWGKKNFLRLQKTLDCSGALPANRTMILNVLPELPWNNLDYRTVLTDWQIIQLRISGRLESCCHWVLCPKTELQLFCNKNMAAFQPLAVSLAVQNTLLRFYQWQMLKTMLCWAFTQQPPPAPPKNQTNRMSLEAVAWQHLREVLSQGILFAHTAHHHNWWKLYT